MSRMEVVGLVGHIGSGKTSIAKYLEAMGFVRITLSDFLKEEALSRGWRPTRRNLQDLGDELRKTNDAAVLVQEALKKAQSLGSTQVVIDGLRNPDEVRALRLMPKALVIGVLRAQPADQAAKLAVRRERNPKEPPWGQRVADTIKMADVLIEYSGSLADLYNEVDSVLFNRPRGTSEI